MERTLKPWEVKDNPSVIDERPRGVRSKSSRNIGERSLQEIFIQALEIPAHKRNPQRDVIKTSSSRPTVTTRNSKNIQPQRPSSIPLSFSRTDIPVHPSRPMSTTQGSDNNSIPLRALALPSPPSALNEVASVPISLRAGSPIVHTVEDERSSPPPSYEVTEWTAFLDRIQRNSSSATYEDLLLLEEVNGPSSASSARKTGRGVSNQLLNASVGPIELLHRRTTKEGKAKLKLALAGQRVERCGICLAQFKSGENGALTECSHTFHKSCLQRWVTQSASCPMCRVALAPDCL